MTDAEQLKLVTPEYTQGLSELDSLAVSILNQFPDDIEYSRTGFRLPLRSEGMSIDTYFTVTKSLPYPYTENPDWADIPAKLGKVTDWSDGGGYVTRYEMKEGLLTSRSYPYENNEFLDEELPTRELAEAEVRKLIGDLSVSEPTHPDKVAQERAGRTAKIGAFILRALFRK